MSNTTPLAERVRPGTLDNYVGQEHLVGQGAVLRRMVESGNPLSMIFWGPPGVGKTTLAQIITRQLGRLFFTLSAVNSGVKEVREVLAKAQEELDAKGNPPVLFIDEIHRFSKSQQDSLLGAVEKGIVILIGATTENPSFEIIAPLLSRCQVYVLKPLSNNELHLLWEKAIAHDPLLASINIQIVEPDALYRFAGGDARKFLNIIELVYSTSVDKNRIEITNDSVIKALQQNIAIYDKQGEMHYDIASAFIKSIRGSDPDAALYWLARMVAGGEDPKFIARRLVISAAEDIGLANPNALLIATSCFEAIQIIGWPESRIILSQTTIYLAASPKSNSAYLAIDRALELVKSHGNIPVPLHLRNAPTKLMKELGYGKDYKYAHDYAGNFVYQEYLPSQLINQQIWSPGNNYQEEKLKSHLKTIWKYRFE